MNSRNKISPVKSSPVKDFNRSSITYDDGETPETKDLKLELERMKTSILILNKQLLIKNEDIDAQKN